MDFLRTVQNISPVIITTARAEFALESYQFNVVDYLLKPFSFERFTQAIDKVTSILKKETEKEIYIKSGHDFLKVSRQDIIFIKSENNYTEIFTATGKHLTTGSLRDWMMKLGEGFKQVHKSYIINAAHLKKISNNKVHLGGVVVIPIGRAFKQEFMKGIGG